MDEYINQLLQNDLENKLIIYIRNYLDNIYYEIYTYMKSDLYIDIFNSINDIPLKLNLLNEFKKGFKPKFYEYIKLYKIDFFKKINIHFNHDIHSILFTNTAFKNNHNIFFKNHLYNEINQLYIKIRTTLLYDLEYPPPIYNDFYDIHYELYDLYSPQIYDELNLR